MDNWEIQSDDAIKDNALYVHTPEKIVRFGRDQNMIYTHVPTKLGKNKNKNKQEKHDETQHFQQGCFVNTVEENKLFYTPREVERAKRARDLLAALGSPSVADLKAAIAMNAIANLPVKTEDVNLAKKIFGKDLATLKGKTTKTNPYQKCKIQLRYHQKLEPREIRGNYT